MRRVTVVLISIIALAGCSSGSDDDEAAEPVDTTVAPTSSSTTRTTPSTGPAAGAGGLVTAADLPAGWGDPENGFGVIEQALLQAAVDVPSCRSADILLAAAGAERTVGAFDHQDGTSLTYAAATFADPAAAQAAYDKLSSAPTATCYTDLINSVLGIALTGAGYEPVPDLGDDARTLTLTGPARTIEITQVLAGRSVLSWSVNGPAALDLSEARQAAVEAMRAAAP